MKFDLQSPSLLKVIFFIFKWFLRTISLISASVSALKWLLRTQISVIRQLLVSESLRVAALLSSTSLQEISSLRMLSFNFKYSAKDSQKEFPNKLDERLRDSMTDLFCSKSWQSLCPALSSNLFNFKLMCFRDLLTLRALAMNLEPPQSIKLSSRLRWVKIWDYSKYLAILRAPRSPILLCERSSCVIVLLIMSPFWRIPARSSSIKFPGRDK